MSATLRFGVIACAAALLLAACGNKGDLVLPATKSNPPKTTPAPPAKDDTGKPATSP
jgi:predicted small lipoprotein YifL